MARLQLGKCLARAAGLVLRPDIAVMSPALALAWLWFDIRGAVLVAAACLPLLWLAQRTGPRQPPPRDRAVDVVTGLPARDAVMSALEQGYLAEETTGKSTACIVLGLDEPQRLREIFGPAAQERALKKTAERLRGALRDQDVLGRIGGERFAVALTPSRRMDLEAVIQIAARLKDAVAEPLSIDAATAYVSASAGFCLAGRARARSGEALLAAAEAAFAEAARNGPGAIRAYSADIARAAAARDALQDRIDTALENGEIVAYYQPQLSTDTGDVSGFEALARWQHPERGVLAPAEFLPVILDAGLGVRLGEVMLNQALSALRHWDGAGLDVPGVAVNFSREELRDPTLVGKLKWHLDRFDQAPDRLTAEVLESVAAEADDDVIVRNIASLSQLGCAIDLDDFGTGHASIASIRRFAVHRIKIDRSYVTRVDSDPAQRRMVAALLSMAERLGLQTLAEGVETVGEHAILAQLGCTHVQGYAIAHPMPLQATPDWIRTHRAKLAVTPDMSRRSR